jgi:uncharacterized protein YeaO (DUF488 family)
MPVSVKRVYDKASRTDGARVLVDRLWPRGLTKEAAQIHLWLKNVAPSDALRKWFHAHPQHWMIFRRKYLKELVEHEGSVALSQLYDFARRKKRLTLLYASKNVERNNATVLKELLDGMRKPPTGTGPAAAMGTRVRKRAALPR